MALVVDAIELESGISVSNSYARIDSIRGSKDSLSFTLTYYVNQQYFLSGKSFIKQEVYSFEPSVEDESPNFIKQGYEYLKSLDKFNAAEDL